MADKRDDILQEDGFWDLNAYAPKKQPPSPHKEFSKAAISAVEIESDLTKLEADPHTLTVPIQPLRQNASPLTNLKSPESAESEITRFIPPHKAQPTIKSYTLFSYKPTNPLIEEVKICAPHADDRMFPSNNMFIRERRALLNKTSSERPHVSYYSMSPRYSQMSRSQLSYYLWWRENARKGNFLQADESYIVLYTYELVTCGEEEDARAALDMLCALLQHYGRQKNTGPHFAMMLGALIADFALLNGLSVSLAAFEKFETVIGGYFALPEFLIDLSEQTRVASLRYGISQISMYDYKRSKLYPENAALFQKAIDGALEALMLDETAFSEITSFTKGVYGLVTVHRRPFARLVNIANRSVSFEISYHQLSGMTAVITDAMRYSENKLREHLGVKGKLHVLAVNPIVKAVLDRYFAEHYPPMVIPDRRRKSAIPQEEEKHDYDHFYDVPKADISPEHAFEIERLSWDTTKILTDAFSEEESEAAAIAPQDSITEPEPPPIIEAPVPVQSIAVSQEAITAPAKDDDSLLSKIRAEIGGLSDFILLCKRKDHAAQRKFALSHALSCEELADRINEAAVNCFGDILLEEDGGGHRILQDYIDLFEGGNTL